LLPAKISVMNFYRVLIVSTLFLTYLIQIVSEWLNVRSLRLKIPSELEGLYDAEKYRLSQEYTRERTVFGFIESTFSLAVLYVFWSARGFNRLDAFVRSFEFGTIATGIIYIGILVIASQILSLPFSIYSTFVIEEKYGFNRTTVRTFIMDRLKGLLLTALLGVPLLAVILWFFQVAGGRAWLYCWLFSALFMFVIQFIAPIWLMPLFNKFTPLPEGELKDRLREYCNSVRFHFRDIFVVDGSKRSAKANAFFTGFGRNKRIALFDTLLEQQTVPEIVSVLAHEVGHYKKKHVFRMMIFSIAQLGIVFFILSLFITKAPLFAAFFMDKVSIYAGLLFFGLLYEPISFLIAIAMNMLSRHDELEADRFAVKTTDQPDNMINALKKLSVKNLSNLTPHPFYVFLHYSHPPLLARVQSIRNE
jgi:STE24 endopeptidase